MVLTLRSKELSREERVNKKQKGNGVQGSGNGIIQRQRAKDMAAKKRSQNQ